MKDLKSTRKALRVTQLELSEMTGINQGYLSELERGVHPPSERTRNKIESALGTKIDWIGMTDTKFLKGSYYESERLVFKLVKKTTLMDEPERKAITKLIRKYFTLK